MNHQIQRGLRLLNPGSVIPVDVKTVADLYAALKYVVEQDEELAAVYLPKEKDDTCPACKRDGLMLSGTGKHWKCGTCGYSERVEVQEP